MPNPDGNVPLVAQVQAERYGMPLIDANRSRLIAALHALINWLIEHPDIPVPGNVRLTYFPLMDGGKLTETDLIDLAHALDGEVGAERGAHWMRSRVLPRESGALVEYVAFAGDAADITNPL
jgi:hypothetical protein